MERNITNRLPNEFRFLFIFYKSLDHEVMLRLLTGNVFFINVKVVIL